MDRKKANQELNKLRIHEQEIKSESGKLADAPITVMPEDLRMMYSSYIVIDLLKRFVAYQNKLKGLARDYGNIYSEVEDSLKADLKQYQEGFISAKKKLEKIAKKHPLAKELCKIKGFTPYQLGLIMGYVKDISKFDTPSKLCVYAGVANKHGMHISKTNITAIRKEDHRLHPGRESEFGFNTAFKGRMYIIVDCLLRSRGYFYYMHGRLRERLEQRAINNNECFVASEDQQKDSKGKMKAGQYYMRGRKNQSLKAWSNSNARWRIARTLLHLIYTEWRQLRNLPARNPYPIDYLGHNSLITLNDVLDYESS